MIVLGQYGAIMVGNQWYCVSIGPMPLYNENITRIANAFQVTLMIMMMRKMMRMTTSVREDPKRSQPKTSVPPTLS